MTVCHRPVVVTLSVWALRFDVTLAPVSNPFARVKLVRFPRFGAVPVGVPFIPAVALDAPPKPSTQLNPALFCSVTAEYANAVLLPALIVGVVPNPVAPRYTWHTTCVAPVHVPLDTSPPVEILYPSLAPCCVPAVPTILVNPAGSAGIVAVPAKYAQTTIISPLLVAAIATLAALADTA